MTEPMIKICGVTTPEGIRAAAGAGATHIGLVHFARSPRHLTIAQAARLREQVAGPLRVVLLTVDLAPAATAEILQAVEPDALQLHGQETPEWLAQIKAGGGIEVWKAIGIKDQATLESAARYGAAAHRLIYDAPAGILPGGNGLALDWRLLQAHRHALPWGLAGGLNAQNVGAAIRATGARLVDASSGVESAPGIKDPARIAAFCKAAHAAMAERCG